MIGYLEGQIKHYAKGKALLFAGGIGFAVFTPSTYAFSKGIKVELFIHTHLRDDNLSLFGFKTAEELDLFELLITVSGVGPKTALNIFDFGTPEKITDAIKDSNLTFFTSISGLGKKTAQKIILDLKSKISKGDISLAKLEGDNELVDSLLSLGFQKSEIGKVIGKIDSTEPLPSQIKNALKLLSK